VNTPASQQSAELLLGEARRLGDELEPLFANPILRSFHHSLPASARPAGLPKPP
jgi:hypothetical protein